MFKVCDYLDLWVFCKEEIRIGNQDKNILRTINKCEELVSNKFDSVDLFMKNYN